MSIKTTLNEALSLSPVPPDAKASSRTVGPLTPYNSLNYRMLSSASVKDCFEKDKVSEATSALMYWWLFLSLGMRAAV